MSVNPDPAQINALRELVGQILNARLASEDVDLFNASWEDIVSVGLLLEMRALNNTFDSWYAEWQVLNPPPSS